MVLFSCAEGYVGGDMRKREVMVTIFTLPLGSAREQVTCTSLMIEE